jgi:hypothetical protein
MIGALIPDAEKMGYLEGWIRYLISIQQNELLIDVGYLFKPLHSPAGAMLLAGIVSLFFSEHKRILALLVLGISTHFFLDLFLTHVTGGEILLLFPLSLEMYQLNLIQTDSYYPVLIALSLALLLFIYERKTQK